MYYSTHVNQSRNGKESVSGGGPEFRLPVSLGKSITMGNFIPTLVNVCTAVHTLTKVGMERSRCWEVDPSFVFWLCGHLCMAVVHLPI